LPRLALPWRPHANESDDGAVGISALARDQSDSCVRNDDPPVLAQRRHLEQFLVQSAGLHRLIETPPVHSTQSRWDHDVEAVSDRVVCREANDISDCITPFMDDAPAIDGHAGAPAGAGRVGSVHTCATFRTDGRFTDTVEVVDYRSDMAVSDRVAAAVTHRRSWVIALLIAVGAGVFIALAGPNSDADKAPLQVPPSAESARVAALLKSFPGGDQQPAILVVSRVDGEPLTPADIAAAHSARHRVLSDAAAEGPPLIPSRDGRAVVTPVPLSADLSGFRLRDTITGLRTSATHGAPTDLVVQVTGPPAFISDITNAMSNANFTLLAATATVVALLLVITYRSPVLWLVPLAVIGT